MAKEVKRKIGKSKLDMWKQGYKRYDIENSDILVGEYDTENTLKGLDGQPVYIIKKTKLGDKDTYVINDKYSEQAKYLNAVLNKYPELSLGSDGHFYRHNSDGSWSYMTLGGIGGGGETPLGKQAQLGTAEIPVPAMDMPEYKKEEETKKRIKQELSGAGDGKYRLPKEYLDMYVAMSQGENKPYDFQTYKPTDAGASITGAILEGVAEGGMQRLNKAITADLGKKDALKMAQDVGEAYGEKFTEETPESAKRTGEINKEIEDIKKYIDMRKPDKYAQSMLEQNVESSKPIKSGYQSKTKSGIEGGEYIGVRNAGVPGTNAPTVLSQTEKEMYAKTLKNNPEYMKLAKQYGDIPEIALGLTELKKAFNQPEYRVTGGMPIENKDLLTKLKYIYENYEKQKSRDAMKAQIELQSALYALKGTDFMGTAVGSYLFNQLPEGAKQQFNTTQTPATK